MLRSPVELHAAVWRAVGQEPEDVSGLHWQASQEDQELLTPPNVRGWVGGLAWITAKTLLERRKHLGWRGWEFYNGGDQRIPERLDGVLPTLWFATALADPARVAAAAADAPWDPRGERIRRLLLDPAINCK
jgi:hypothetical protein